MQKVLAAAEEARLIEDYQPLAKKLAAKFYQGSHVEFDDLMSEANMSMLKAARLFDPSKGYTFGTYAQHAVYNALSNLVRAHKRRSGKYTFVDLMPYEDDPGLAQCDDEFEMVEQLEALLGWMETLCEQERYLVRLRLSHQDISQTECAHKLASRFGEYYDQPKVSSMLKHIDKLYCSFSACDD